MTSTLKTTSNIYTCVNCICIHFPINFYNKKELKKTIHDNSVALLQRSKYTYDIKHKK